MLTVQNASLQTNLNPNDRNRDCNDATESWRHCCLLPGEMIDINMHMVSMHSKKYRVLFFRI